MMYRFNNSLCYKKHHKGIFYMTVCHMEYTESVYFHNKFEIHFTGCDIPNF